MTPTEKQTNQATSSVPCLHPEDHSGQDLLQINCLSKLPAPFFPFQEGFCICNPRSMHFRKTTVLAQNSQVLESLEAEAQTI